MRTISQLQVWQGSPLEIQEIRAKRLIKEFIGKMQGDAYISFSGGLDSTVLLHLVRSVKPSLPAVFLDTGLEHREIRDFVKKFDNVET